MKWWGRMMVPLRKGWIKVATLVGLRKTGFVKLRHDVKTCEYEDVHILWEMLKRNEAELARSSGNGKGRFWTVIDWASSPLPCYRAV